MVKGASSSIFCDFQGIKKCAGSNSNGIAGEMLKNFSPVNVLELSMTSGAFYETTYIFYTFSVIIDVHLNYKIG